MKKILAIIFLIFISNNIFPQSDFSRYNVTWNSPGKDYTSSMPLGNGDISLNAWTEESGDLVFYIGKTDSWDENGRLLKIGCVRVKIDHLSPSMLTKFKQTLNLADASIQINMGNSKNKIKMRLWVDANNPVIHLEISSNKSVTATAYIESWRKSEYELPSIEISDIMFKADSLNYRPTFVEPDSIINGMDNRIGWFHHNSNSIGPVFTAKMQGLQGFQRQDPILGRTFGAIITSGNSVRENDTTLKSGNSVNHNFNIYVLTKQPASAEEWLGELNSKITEIGKVPLKKHWKHHTNWWKEFWNRSWIDITPASKDSLLGDETFTVSRAYTLQRFITACAGRGNYPIKFNGSIFTVPYPDGPGNADYRRWGPGYWWQNTRLPYYPMCAAGDFEMLMPLFNMYGKDLMPFFKYRTKLYLGHDGIYIPECIYFWGEVFTETYGKTQFEKRVDKLQESRWHKYEWVSGLELVYLMLDYYEYTLNENFANNYLIPEAREIITFFNEQYKTINGKLDMEPSQSGETWWKCKNPMPEIAGLHSIINRLLDIKSSLINSGMRDSLITFRNRIPDLPVREFNNLKMLAPADKFENKQNIENMELYSVFPFQLVTFNSKEKQLAVNAFNYRLDKGNLGWRQDDIFAAYLGMTDTVRSYLVSRVKNKNIDSKFPAFWGPNYDWTPDQTHGGIIMKTLQSMLMQTDGKKIYLLPAFPKDWNANFKLHAPFNTTIQGIVKDNKIVKLKVKPEYRRKDIVIVPQ